MKRLIYLAVIFFGTIIISKAQSTPQVTKEPTVYKGVTDQNCAVEVAFGSYSAGIDGTAFEKVKDLIKAYKVAHTAQTIGREGEQRLCMPLTELKKSKKNKFIKQLKKIAKAGQLVSVSIR